MIRVGETSCSLCVGLFDVRTSDMSSLVSRRVSDMFVLVRTSLIFISVFMSQLLSHSSQTGHYSLMSAFIQLDVVIYS